MDSKKRLNDANRLIREQAQQPQPQPFMAQATAAGPSLPPPPPPMAPDTMMPPPPAPYMGHSEAALPLHSDGMAPPAKKPRLDATTDGMPPPPVPGAIPPALAAPELVPPGLAPVPPPIEPPEPVEILSEEEFAASLGDPTVHLTIQIPDDASNAAWNFNGQVISLSVDVMSKVKVVKQELRSHLGGMPMNKIQLKSQSTGFLKDSLSLAILNIGPNAALEMVPKTRGGRK